VRIAITTCLLIAGEQEFEKQQTQHHIKKLEQKVAEVTAKGPLHLCLSTLRSTNPSPRNG